MRKKRAVVVGLEYYAKFLAQLMNSETPDWRFRAYGSTRMATLRAINALRWADVLISFGGPAPNAALIEAARRRNIPVFVIWAGSDVLKARQDPFALEVVKQEEFINLADGSWLVDELRPLGIEAEYFPLTAVQSGGPVKPFDARFRVLTYLPEPRRDFYGATLVYDVARAMPDVPFMVVGAGGRDERAPANVHFAGMVNDMQDRIDACTVLLREPEHDGKSMLVLEALARARHVIWNYRFPHVRFAREFGDIVSQLQDLKELHGRRQLELNHAGRAFVLQEFARADIAKRFARRLDKGIEEWRASRHRACHRVAVSGLELFCAEVATYGKRFAPQWETRLLRANSRLDVLTSILTLMTCDVWYSIGSPVTDRWIALFAKLLHKPRVIHWVGSDIAGLAENDVLRRQLDAPNIMHLAEVGWTARELRELGFSPRIVALPPRHRIGRPVPLPEKFTITLYVPRTRSDFYGRRDFERLMATLAGKPIRYYIVGGGEVNVPDGVEAVNFGWKDTLAGIYENTTCLIRFTPRDGLSLMVLEVLSYGRHVLWTQKFPHTRFISNFDSMYEEVLNLFALHERGELKPQADATRMIEELYAPEKCIQEIAGAWSDAMNKSAARLAMESL